jgi:hypothetical protein
MVKYMKIQGNSPKGCVNAMIHKSDKQYSTYY